ncbi:hybrid sensor histidine kinase/response regulator [Actibacterium lipolyticum]|nr:PAS domain-containing hybrid sensor histidine kinase/response regulator [Actibacterium lipolyticum]
MLAFAMCATTIFVLSVEVRNNIDALAVANSDNIQWNLSQMEVELYALDAAVLRADAEASSDLRSIRKRFDVFYSRVDILRTSPLYKRLRGEPLVHDALERVGDFFDRNIVLIDGPDGLLSASLPGMTQEIGALHEPVRAISLRGVEVFATGADLQRVDVVKTLRHVAAITIGLVVALSILILFLLRVNRISQERATENQMTTSRLEAVVSTSLDGIVVINRMGRVLEFNGAAERIFGYTADEAVGANLSELIVPESMRAGHESGMQRYRETGEKRVVGQGLIQLDAQRKDGTLFPSEFSISTAQSSSGEIFVSFLRDISDRITAEQELMEARDNALAGEKAKAELLAVMSHEMRTPLNGLLGTMELLEGTELTTRQQEYLEIMGTSGKLLLHHVNDVLDISRLDAGKVEIQQVPFDMDSLLEEIVNGQLSLAKAAGNTLEAQNHSENLHMAIGDPRRLRQILLNLVGNAVKFTRNGSITIEVEQLHDDDVVEFRVQDTGIGIADEDLSRVFDDFVTLDTSYVRETGGTGLGLGISRRMAAAMGGEMGVVSELGEGSLFWLRLPLSVPTSRYERSMLDNVPDGHDSPKTKTARPLSVLVVEDNRINRMVVREMLEKQGHTVSEAHDGDEGVGAAMTKRFDLILMDISMPRMDGVEATRRIRSSEALSKDVPIVALTAHALPDDIARFTAAGMDDSLVKPISQGTLRRTIDRVCDNYMDAGNSNYEPSGGGMSGGLDMGLFQALRNDIGQDTMETLVKAFISETDDAIVRLTGPWAGDADDAELIAAIHKTAGSAAVFGAVDLSRKLRDLETQGKADESVQMRAELGELAGIWDAAKSAVMNASAQ